MEFDCSVCDEGTSSNGSSCTICGGDGLINLTDPAFKSIDHGTQKVLYGVVWDAILTLLTNIETKCDGFDTKLDAIDTKLDVIEDKIDALE